MKKALHKKKKSGRKPVRNLFLVALFVVTGFVLIGISDTQAFYSDIESSTGNTFSAGTLMVQITSNSVSGIVYPGDATTTSITVSKTSPTNLDYQYVASSTFSGDTTACDYINLEASTSAQTYSGLIRDFKSATATPAGPEQWNLMFTVAGGVPHSVVGKTCNYKILYTAWQTSFADSTQGFSDTEEVVGSITIGNAVVLNEILPNPVGADDAPKPGGEWVELYNNSGASIDLSGWYLYDSTDSGEVPVDSSHTGSGSTIISSHGFLVVYRNGDSDFNLNNAGDSVRLFTKRISAGGVLIDSFTWTTEKAVGLSYARIPDGVGAWVDPVPTPGAPNEIGEVPLQIPVADVNVLEIATTTATSTLAVEEDTASSTESGGENGLIGGAAGDSTASTTGEVIDDATSSSDNVISKDPEVASTTPAIGGNSPEGAPDIEAVPPTEEVIGEESAVEPVPEDSVTPAEESVEIVAPAEVNEPVTEIVSAILPEPVPEVEAPAPETEPVPATDPPASAPTESPVGDTPVNP